MEAKYHIACKNILAKEIDNYTLITVKNYIENKMCDNIWMIPNTCHTQLFYKKLYEAFVRIGDAPFICLMYDANRNEFFQTYTILKHWYE